MISVIMTVYNEKISYLSRSVSSILNQTYKDIQLIIIDDNPNSTDIKKFLENIDNDNIKVFFNKVNLGQAISRNIGINHCDGEYIAIMDSDDISNVDRFEKQLKFMDDNKLDFVYSNFSVFEEDGREVRNKMWNLNNICDQDYLKNIILNAFNPSLQSSWLMKKSVMRKLNGYRNLVVEDLDFNLRAFENGIKQGFQSDVLIRKRVRNNGVMNSNVFESSFISRYLVKMVKKRGRVPSMKEIKIYYKKIYSDKVKENFEEFVKSLYDFKKCKTLLRNFKFIYFIFCSKYSILFLYETILKKINRFYIEKRK